LPNIGGKNLQKIELRTSLLALGVALGTIACCPALAQTAAPDSAADQSTTTSSAANGDQSAPPVPDTTPDETARRAKIVQYEDTIQVTGSRLQNGDPTAHLTVITAKEIQARGVTSVEELIRTLPQNVATIGAITNDRSKGPLRTPGSNTPSVSPLGQLGVSAANLGGSGAGNTLILVNGRRMAGAAGIEQGFVNLNNIPFNAIERVEIDMSGASAVYGADAIGGVINFILKKNYTGTTLTAQHEFSSNAASNTRFGVTSGLAWGTGNLSGTASYTHRNPINNYKTGYVTQNYSSFYNGDPTFDKRSFARGLQPGVIVSQDYVFNPKTFNIDVIEKGLSVRPGLTGAPRVSDFITLDPSQKRDYIPERAGPEADTITASLNFEQEITRKLSFFADGFYTRSKNFQLTDYATGLSVELAPGQAYNPFPAYSFDSFTPGTRVYYYPGAEITGGKFPDAHISNTVQQWTGDAGLRYQLNNNTRIEFVFTTSTSRSMANSTVLNSPVSFVRDPASPTGYRCSNFQLDNGQYRGPNIEAYRQTIQKQCLALSSSDPAVAFNPWRSNLNAPGIDATAFLYNDDQENRESLNKNYELHMNGRLFNLPAGSLNYAIGGEYNDDGINSREVNTRTGTAVSRSRWGVFGEMTIPVIGGRWKLPLVRSLLFDVAARNDTYLTDGAVGTIDNVPFDQGGKLIFGHNRFSRITPSLGFRWEPARTFVIRGKWSQGFRPPPPTQLFSVTGTNNTDTAIWDDPLYTCTTDCKYISGSHRAYAARSTTAPNPDLRPQTSDQYNIGGTWSPSGVLQGLRASVTYNYTHISNEYANLGDLLQIRKSADVLKIAQFYPRDANGKITTVRNMIFNIAGSKYSSISYELNYSINTKFGLFEPRLMVLQNLKAERQISHDSAPISQLGYVLGPDKYKIVGGLAWSKGDFNLMLWGYYTPEYLNNYTVTRSGGNVNNTDQIRPVRSYTTFDLTGSWRVRKDVRMNLAARNIFDAKPPFAVIDSLPYDTARYNVAGRTASIELQFSF
jgi:iron complex outermembrane receptor protein